MTKTRATAAARRARYRRSWPTSSVRWRSERPPIVLLGEIRHCCRILLTFTRPYFGTASSMSKTFAVSTYSGGSSSSAWIETRPALQIPLELRPAGADLVRALERVHPLDAANARAPPSASAGVFGGRRHRAASLHTETGPGKPRSGEIRLDLDLRLRSVQAG